jgi:excinuclease ABC subunit B
MEETERRRTVQTEYNLKHGITPESVRSVISSGIEDEIAAHKMVAEVAGRGDDYVTEEYLEELQAEMLKAAADMEFERAAQLRDKIAKLKGQPSMAPQKKPRRRKR